ncbi:MAG: transposase [Salinarimonas sp.]
MHQSNDTAFCNEEAAYRFVEARVWPDGPVCAHCGRGDRVGRLAGKDPKPGAYKCYACRKPFNVKLGTMLESTHVPLHLWLQALFLLHACDPPVSVNRLHSILGVSSRTTWLMSQRFRDRLKACDHETGDTTKRRGDLDLLAGSVLCAVGGGAP